MTQQRRILVTGSSGFVGFHLCRRMLGDGDAVLGIDNFSPYYDVTLKEQRSEILREFPDFSLQRISIEDRPAFEEAWRDFKPDIVVHLAAQAGVRYSIENPDAYVNANLIGTFNVLELARRHPIQHLLAASTSSVYGANDQMPFKENERTATPLTLYAATKGATELMGHAYANLFRVPTTFFRFFTVYGPWGRPDMALFKFLKAMLADAPIDVFNNGEMRRDFTYVEDIVEAIVRLIKIVPGSTPAAAGDSLSRVAPFRVVNIGQGKPVSLMDYIGALEAHLGRTAKKRFLPIQLGDVRATGASPALLEALTGYTPTTPVDVGVPQFVDWYISHYGA